MKNGNREDWFKSKYNINNKNGCWEWFGANDKRGYGRFGDKPYSIVLAHRYSYTLKHGEIPNGMHLCHKCDNPKCVNPDHLFLGTAKDNYDDCKNKGRHSPPPHPSGSGHPRSKLSQAQVKELRELYATGNYSQRKLSALFNLSQPCMGS